MATRDLPAMMASVQRTVASVEGTVTSLPDMTGSVKRTLGVMDRVTADVQQATRKLPDIIDSTEDVLHSVKTLTASVSPSLLWPPNGTIVNVTVSGTAFDGGSGVATIEWSVVDEYRQQQPFGTVTVPGNGPFSFQVPLLRDRRGNDKDGRHYRINLTAVDRFGNRLLLAQPLVVNVHDQSGM